MLEDELKMRVLTLGVLPNIIKIPVKGYVRIMVKYYES